MFSLPALCRAPSGDESLQEELLPHEFLFRLFIIRMNAVETAHRYTSTLSHVLHVFGDARFGSGRFSG